MTRALDETDRTLLGELSADGRQTVRSLARVVAMSEPSVRDRLQRLERDGVITGYHVSLEPNAVDAGTAAFIALRFASDQDAKDVINAALQHEPGVLEVHEVAGEDCYWLKVRTPSTEGLAELLDRVRALPYVDGTATTIVLRTIFERPLSVPGAGDPRD